MKPDEVRRAVTFLYGKEAGGQRALAASIGKHELTVSRYVRGVAPVGETEAILIRLLVERKRLKSWQLSEEQLSALD
jgi:DNA-binding transcriptional regulator YdaS (Cro superfamily)